MITIVKILKLLPDNWSDTLDKAEEMGGIMEGYFTKSSTFLEEKKATLDTLVNNLFTDLNIDVNALHSNVIYKKLENIVIDFPELAAIPEDLDVDNMDDIRTFIEGKMEYLRTQLADLEFDAFDLDTVLAELQGIIAIVMDIPEDLDFNDTEALAQLKNEKLTQLKPAIFRLLEQLLNMELAGTGIDTGIDTGIEKLNAVSDVIVADNNESNTNNEPISAISTIKNKLPLIEQELADVAIPGVDITKTSESSSAVLSLMEEKIPLIEEQLTNADWEHFEPTTWISQVKDIFNHVKVILDHPSLAGVFSVVQATFGLIRLKEIDAATALTKLKDVLDLPDDLELNDNTAIVEFIKSKVTELIDLVAYIEIEGINTDEIITKARDFTDSLLNISDDTGIDRVADLGFVLFDKLITFFQDNITTVNTPNGWFEQLQKIQLIWKFVNNNSFHVSLKDKNDIHQNPIENNLSRMMNTMNTATN